MIIPMVCFSCGKPIAHLWDQYLVLIDNYKKDPTSLRTFRETHPHVPPNVELVPEFVALAQLKIGRECCRRMFLSQHDMYQKVC